MNLVKHGQLPERGNLSSYSSYNTPGPRWLLAPGALLFKDSRLIQLPGLVVIYGGTVIGIFVLARHFFGVWCAYLATWLFAFSALGLTLANSLWPRYPPQFFLVWTVYWACLWVGRGNSKYLAYALVTWAAGLYVFMELAPVLFILPVLWVIYHPPVRIRPLIFSGAAFLLMWFPYLRYEYERGFLDLRSLVGRVDLLPNDYKAVWCDPSLKPKIIGSDDRVDQPASVVNPSSRPETEDESEIRGWRGFYWQLQPFFRRGIAKAHTVLQGFDFNAAIPKTSALLLLLTVTSLICFGMRPRPGAAAPGVAHAVRSNLAGKMLRFLAVGMILAGMVANEFFLARYASSRGVLDSSQRAIVRSLQTILILGGLVIFLRHWLWRILRAAAAQRQMDARPLVLSLLVPWLILAVLVEPTRGDRFWFLWPLQTIFLAALMTVFPRHLGLPRSVACVGGGLLVLLGFGYTLAQDHGKDWRENGWSGADAEEMRIVDQIAAQLQAEGRHGAAIGYQTSFTSGEARQYVIDTRYKVGAHWDFLFRQRHQIANETHCPEGVSVWDEYRIVETGLMEGEDPSPGDPFEVRAYFPLPPPRQLQLIRQYNSYRVFGRRPMTVEAQ